MALAAAMAIPGGAVAGAIFSGQLLTNFATATLSAPSGVEMRAEGPGFGIGRVPRSQTAWVLVADGPTVCLRSWKQAWPAQAAPGDRVTFRISVSSCGGYSAFNVTVTDQLPANTKYAGGLRGWTSGAAGTWWHGDPPLGQGAPFKLQWMLDVLGQGQSAHVEFQAEIL